MTLPHGERPLLILCIVGLLVLAGIIAPWLASEIAHRHPRSVYRRTKGERE